MHMTKPYKTVGDYLEESRERARIISQSWPGNRPVKVPLYFQGELGARRRKKIQAQLRQVSEDLGVDLPPLQEKPPEEDQT